MNKITTVNVDGSSEIQLPEAEITLTIDSNFVYPTFKNLKGKELSQTTKELTFPYQCDLNSCKFPLEIIRQSTELKSLGLKQSSFLVVDTIEKNQDLFTARQCGGFLLQVGSSTQIYLPNETVVPNDSTRFGFADLKETRRQLLHTDQIRHLGQQTSQPSIPLLNIASFLAGNLTLFGVLKYLKKL